MDGTELPPNRKAQKLFEGNNMEPTYDRISNLPDSILLHILSFMSTKEAIRTSTLSTRWRDLWVFLPIIDMDDGLKPESAEDSMLEKPWERNFMSKYSFVVLVSKALLYRDTLCLRKFCLGLNMSVSLRVFKGWISAAIDHNVEVLDLNLRGKTEYVFPSSFFISKSLCTLAITMYHTLVVPSRICFSSLKKLYLSGVEFQDNESTELFFSGFPVLQQLALYCCDWENLTTVTFKIPTLESFYFHAETTENDVLDCTIELYAENLKYLKYTGYFIVELILCNISSLVYASISLYDAVELDYQMKTEFAADLLDAIGSVKFLTISIETLKYLFHEDDFVILLPIFYNLIHLEMGVNPVGEDDYFAGKELTCFLQNTPNLESLDIPVGINEFILETVPDCFKSCLKSVSISVFEANLLELDFLNRLFASATALEKVTILFYSKTIFNLEKQEKIKRDLQILRRKMGLEMVKVSFERKF